MHSFKPSVLKILAQDKKYKSLFLYIRVVGNCMFCGLFGDFLSKMPSSFLPRLASSQDAFAKDDEFGG